MTPFHSKTKHYTKPFFATALVQGVLADPGVIVDPAAGNGALLLACSDRWPKAQLRACDISASALRQTAMRLPLATLHRGNALLASWFSDSTAPRLVVCNPPFGPERTTPSTARLDVRFLEKAMIEARPSDTILFVLPQSLASNACHTALRRDWMNRFALRRVIGLPDNAFENTEATAIALIGTPGTATRGNVEFLVLGRNACVVQRAFSPIDPSTDRLDPGFYTARSWLPMLSCETTQLHDIVRDVRRGTFFEKNTLTASTGRRLIHSTDLRPGWITPGEKRFAPGTCHSNVETGCVLIARVGARLWDKFALYTARQTAVATDCVLVTRTHSPADSPYLAAALGTRFVRTSIRRLTRGITAPILCKQDFLALPIPWPSLELRRRVAHHWLDARTPTEQRRLLRAFDLLLEAR